jgi:polyisoprenyl-phosphate glycosyltransferase
MSPDTLPRVLVVAPVYDDAEAAARLLEELAGTFAGTDLSLRVLLVDDGSPVPLAGVLRVPPGLPVEVLRLRRNVGHQRAIGLGVAFVHEQRPCDAVLVMDADGEDRPADALKLVRRCRETGGSRVIFAERTRRSESPLFQVLYRAYQVLHWLLTGIRVRVGNFSVVPAGQLAALVSLPALWNHYAAAIFQAHLPRELVPCERGRRYHGRSKMNLVALVVHGLQAISVFIEIVAVRLLLGMCLLAGACGGLLVVTLIQSFAPWAPWALGGLLIVILSVGVGCFSLALGLLAQRNRLDFIPLRDYRHFIEACHEIPSRS